MEVVYRVISRDGTVRWIADRAKARHTPDGAIIADSISIEVTEHRRVTDELAAARARPRAHGRRGRGSGWTGLLAAADAGFTVLDVEAGRVAIRFADPRWRSACWASRCRPASTWAPPSTARSSRTSASAW